MPEKAPLYGLMAEYDAPEDLLAATQRAYAAGYRRMDAYSPFPVDGLADALGVTRPKLPLLVLGGGIVGAIGGYLLQYYTSVITYPLNIGGRPFHSWPAFIPVTFETAILVAAVTAVLGMLALNGLPRPHHPVFNVERFERASSDQFFLCIESADTHFDYDNTKQFLISTSPREVTDVPY
jgi:Protein of unknown function (DUF3341)